MSQLVKKIRTSAGDCQIDYNALANLPTISNPNLLINSDFRDPVNQRGKTSYTTTNERIYTIDRWNIGQGTLTVNSASVIFEGNTTAGASARWFGQKFERALTGTHRVSFNCPVVTGEVLIIIRNNNDITNDIIYSISSGFNQFSISHPSGSFDEIFFRMVTNNKLEIEWIKLEQGTTVTPLVPKFKAEELINCYRFFYSQDSRLLMNEYSALHADGNIYYPIKMRTTPKVTLLEGTYFSAAQNGFVEPASLVVNGGHFSAYSATLKLEKNANDTFSPGMSINANIKICLDAEIY